MATYKEIFSLSGAVHLTDIDWNNAYHRTSVAASLIQGTYILESDRQNQRQGPEALAPGWWDFFYFELTRALVDDTDNSIIGAIYELKLPPHNNAFQRNPPRYVIAIRGTVPNASSLSNDLKLDFQFMGIRLHKSRRFQIAMQAVKEIVSVAGAANIWLAGHSSGAAIALLAGQNMVESGCPVETYLFNPPFTSSSIDKIKNEKVKRGARIASTLLASGIGGSIAAGITGAVSSKNQKLQRENSFQVLSTWIPYLFVNPSDPICSEYVGYFEQKEKMAGLGAGAGGVGRVATKNSLGSLFSTALGKDIEPTHLLPSAYLTINMNLGNDFDECHEIHQWWKQDSQWQCKLHQFS